MAGGKHKSESQRLRRMYRKRKGVPRTLFRLMAYLFGNKCLCCEQPYDKRNHRRRLSVDHVVPISLGGEYKDLKNLQPLCHECNGKKDNQVIDYRPFIPTEEQLWAAVGKVKK